MNHFVARISCFPPVLHPDEYFSHSLHCERSSIADLKNGRRIRAKDHLFLIIR